MVSSASIMGMTLTMIICFAVPITTMAVLKIRKHAQIFLFLVGISMHLFFVMLLEQLLLNLTVSAFPAMNAVGYSILSAITAGVFEILEFALISKVLRDTLDRGSRALMFGLGHATSNALLSSGLTSLTYYTIAMLVSTEGAETLTKGLSGEELEAAAH